MALTTPRGQFGVKGVTLYDRTTFLPVTYLQVVSEASIDFKAETEDLEGGSNLFPWDTEIKKLGSEISFTGREITAAAMEAFLGGVKTVNAAESSGAVPAAEFVNVKGTSVMQATTGIASVGLKSGGSADLKEGLYIIKCITATTVDVYSMSDVDFGTTVFVDDNLKITASTLTPVTSPGVEVPGFGVMLVKGSGTLGMTVGDTAVFRVRKVNTSSFEVAIGGNNFSEYGALLVGARQSTGMITMMQLYRVKCFGMPIKFNAASWGDYQVTMKALFDSAKNGIGRYLRTIP